MKAAVIQFNATDDKQKNIRKAVLLARRAIARKAEFILLPEAFHYRGKADWKKGYHAIAERIPGPSTKPLMKLAKNHRVAVLAGSICEKAPATHKTYNTAVLIGPDGRILARYRKRRLFDASIGKKRVKESKYFLVGKRGVVAAVKTWRVGLSICYDLRFPELYRAQARAGAEILCVPSAFTRLTGQAHWETLLRARAIENLCYVLAPDQTGKDGRGIPGHGNSLIVDPWGKILARASSDKEEIIYARLDKKILKKSRQILSQPILIKKVKR